MRIEEQIIDALRRDTHSRGGVYRLMAHHGLGSYGYATMGRSVPWGSCCVCGVECSFELDLVCEEHSVHVKPEKLGGLQRSIGYYILQIESQTSRTSPYRPSFRDSEHESIARYDRLTMLPKVQPYECFPTPARARSVMPSGHLHDVNKRAWKFITSTTDSYLHALAMEHGIRIPGHDRRVSS